MNKQDKKTELAGFMGKKAAQTLRRLLFVLSEKIRQGFRLQNPMLAVPVSKGDLPGFAGEVIFFSREAI